MIRILSFLPLCFSTSIVSLAQKVSYVHPSTLGVHFVLSDFKNKIVETPSKLDAGLSLSYVKGLTSRLDYQVTIAGSFPDSISKEPVSSEKSLLLQTAISLRARLFDKKKSIQPYIVSGPGFSFHKSDLVSYWLLGAGIELNYKDIFITTSFQYNLSGSQKLNNHYLYTIGIAGLLSLKQKKSAPVVKTVFYQNTRDRDGDGILDSADLCIDQPGFARFEGCPDSDVDGIEDRKDACPTVFGFEKYKGCPIPDRDNDGINDEEDSCINVPGVKENKGCPLIKQELKDKINLAAKNILFKTGSYELLPISFGSLDEVILLLKNNPSVTVLVEGHTDNTGSDQSNLLLSENRANAVVRYLTNNGIEISRLKVMGFGQTQPIDTNETPAGRTNNRRVVFKLSQ
jgi:OOP family OmpA-OmpF porin